MARNWFSERLGVTMVNEDSSRWNRRLTKERDLLFEKLRSSLKNNDDAIRHLDQLQDAVEQGATARRRSRKK